MSNFSVRPAALNTYADTISGAATNGGLNLAHLYYARPSPYVDSYVKIDQSSGLSDLFSHILSSNTTLVSDLHTTYDDIAGRLSESGLALAGSAKIYESTDEDANARMDQVWPGVGKPPVLDAGLGGGQVTDPSEALDEEPESDVLTPDWVHWIMDYSGWLSISSDVLKLLSLFHIDPMGSLTKAIGGDYSTVARAGNAAKALADFERTSAVTLAAGLSTMTASWTGHAADQATGYFRQFANAFDEHASQLDQVSTKYEMIAQGMYQVATVLSGLLAAVVDWGIKLGIAAAAAGCLQGVPGVDVLVDIGAGYEAFMTAKAVEAFMKACMAIDLTAETIIGLCTEISGLCGPGTAKTAFPTAAYANGAQA